MDDNKYLTENLGEFKKLSSNFKELGDNIDDENESFNLLNSLLETYKELKMALKYGRQKINIDDVILVMNDMTIYDWFQNFLFNKK